MKKRSNVVLEEFRLYQIDLSRAKKEDGDGVVGLE